jgi:hypothetical protein
LPQARYHRDRSGGVERQDLSGLWAISPAATVRTTARRVCRVWAHRHLADFHLRAAWSARGKGERRRRGLSYDYPLTSERPGRRDDEDLTVWYQAEPILFDDAEVMIREHYEGDTSSFTPDERLGLFFAALMKRFPVLESLVDHEFERLGVWSMTPDASDVSISVTISWQRAEEVLDFVIDLAAAHELLVYNGQQNAIVLPPRLHPDWTVQKGR